MNAVKGVKLVLLPPPSPADHREARLPAAGQHTSERLCFNNPTLDSSHLYLQLNFPY